jgi:uncharacterized membrane protein HdeD (DUF308 family)
MRRFSDTRLAGMRWPAVLTEGVVLAIAGAVVWLAPGLGARSVLELLALILLAAASLSAWRLVRHQVSPDAIAGLAFRSGVGVSVGLIVVLGARFASHDDFATIAMAFMLGIGLVVYAVATLLAAFGSREPGDRFPVAAGIIAVLALVVGVLLVFNGRAGFDSFRGTFSLLGIALLIAGLALAGYALVMRARDGTEPIP